MDPPCSPANLSRLSSDENRYHGTVGVEHNCCGDRAGIVPICERNPRSPLLPRAQPTIEHYDTANVGSNMDFSGRGLASVANIPPLDPGTVPNKAVLMVPAGENETC